jgi:hypothetical protein
MRLLRILLTGLFAAFALIAGLFIAAFGIIAYGVGRLLGRSPGNVRVRTQFNVPHRPAPRPRVNTGRGEVIDVTATEVPADPLPR